MLGKIFIEMAIKDFEDFFTTSFTIKRVYKDGVTLKISGSGEDTTLIIPNDFAQMELTDDSDKFYALLLLGHELGHYINKHNHYTESQNEETRAIEMWADFFGTVIAMSLFILGGQIVSQFSFKPNSDKENSLKAICGAFERIYAIYKNGDGSNIYEHSSSRILTIVTGISSFLIRLEISKLINAKKIDLELWTDTYL